MIIMWYDRGHSFLWVLVWVNASQRIPLSAMARNQQKGLVCEISYVTRRREKCKVPGQSTEERS